MNPKTQNSNKLISEKSPYLLQHAYNPVDWYPWNEEAFKKAKKENKPIFLSIGYSTCHWCHVMEHESFEDPEVAKLMNETFVSIKVDREERPDLDNIYMTACQMMTGSGGWPLTVILTPDKKPFFSGTYFPKESRFGRIGMLDFVPRIKEIWERKNNEALSSADEITKLLATVSTSSAGEVLDESVLDIAFEQLAHRFDEQYGGFGDAPKFPTPHNLLFLLRYWKRTGNQKALEMVEKTLQAMQLGGIYDHIGFGFHRYSTDSKWLVPHFEKMLYDQALIAMAFTETYQATHKEEYKKTVAEIFTYVLRDMTDPGGGFYSAQDADSEGEEGKFYVWAEDEVREVLGKEEADLTVNIFNLEKAGNYTEEAMRERTGVNILHLKKSLSGKDLLQQIEQARQKLFNVREKRVHPYKDDKILTDWNGLMIAALAKAAQVFNEPKYSEAAKRAGDFVLTKMCRSDGRLLHRYRDGQAAIPAYLDDYAFFIWGLLELYEATFEAQYLKIALDLNNALIKYFWDDKNAGFYFTSDDTEDILVRKKEIYDGAIPSGNSVAMLNLFRLGRIAGNSDLEEKASKIVQTFSQNVNQVPMAHTQLLIGIDFSLGPAYEVTISGNVQKEDTKAMLKALRSKFVPNKVLLFVSADEKLPEIFQVAKFTKDQKCIDDKATVYVCQSYNCKLPTTDVSTMLQLLDKN